MKIDNQMKKIQKISYYLSLIFNIAIVMTPLFLIAQWIFISLKAAHPSNPIIEILDQIIITPEGSIRLSTVEWTPLSQLLGFCADFIGTLPFFISLFFFKKLFSHYTDGKIFTQENASIYRKLGLLYLVNALFIKLLSDALMTVAVTMNNLAGNRYLSISFGTTHVITLFYGVLILVISWIMQEASRLHDEEQLTI